MTKSELIDAICRQTEVNKSSINLVIAGLADMIGAALAAGEEISLPGIGKFAVVQKPERQGRNPATGESITIAARRAVKFTAAKALKDAAAE